MSRDAGPYASSPSRRWTSTEIFYNNSHSGIPALYICSIRDLTRGVSVLLQWKRSSYFHYAAWKGCRINCTVFYSSVLWKKWVKKSMFYLINSRDGVEEKDLHPGRTTAKHPNLRSEHLYKSSGVCGASLSSCTCGFEALDRGEGVIRAGTEQSGGPLFLKAPKFHWCKYSCSIIALSGRRLTAWQFHLRMEAFKRGSTDKNYYSFFLTTCVF